MGEDIMARMCIRARSCVLSVAACLAVIVSISAAASEEGSRRIAVVYPGEDFGYEHAAKEFLKYARKLSPRDTYVFVTDEAFGNESEVKINLKELRRLARKAAAQQTTYLVASAKAEAVCLLGEPQAAMEILERHLWPRKEQTL